MKQYIPLVELLAEKIPTNNKEDLIQEGMEALCVILKETSDVGKICSYINSKLRQVPREKHNVEFIDTTSCENEGIYNSLRDDVLDLFTGHDRDILSLMIQGYTGEEIGTILSLDTNLVNLQIFYIRKKVRQEWCT